ncbi:YtcA family lipoprotein [Citrobacter braakii]|uniref:YtcA family lipoprotein n=2 Tax=Citrobacter braakii TaxID=57706 RepID=UPI00403A10AA
MINLNIYYSLSSSFNFYEFNKMNKHPGRSSSFRLKAALFVAVSFLTACSPAPSVVFFGASFPDWLLCTGAGVAGMTLLHTLSCNLRKMGWLSPAVVVYPCVTALISMLTWLIFFPS